MPDDLYEFENSPAANRIKLLWKDAVFRDQGAQTPEKAVAFGVNFRIDLLKAVHATFETAKVAIEAAVFTHAPFDLLSAIGVGIEAFSAVRSIISSIVESVPAIQYVTYVIISTHSSGIEEDELKKSVGAFLSDSNVVKFAWYLSMTEDRIRQAKEVTQQNKWFESAVEGLEKKNMILRTNGLIYFKSRNFVVGWNEE